MPVEVARLADRHDDQVGFDVHLGAGLLRELALVPLHLDQAQRLGATALLVDDHLLRQEVALDLHAFALRVLDLVLGRVHLARSAASR